MVLCLINRHCCSFYLVKVHCLAFSDCFCIFHLLQPLSLTINSGLMPIIGQAAIATTVLVTSMSSTALLAIVGHPYVGTLHELFPSKPSENGEKPLRRFRASKFNLFGNKKYTEFTFKDIDSKPKNPFATFMIPGKGMMCVLLLSVGC